MRMSHAERLTRQIRREHFVSTPQAARPGPVVWMAIGLPLLLVGALAIESAGLRNFTPNIDLSQTVIMSVAMGIAVVGVMLAGRGMDRLRPALRRYRGAVATAAAGALLAVGGIAMMVYRVVAGS